MTSMIAGLLCCDEEAKDDTGENGYKLHFNGGRLLGAFVVMILGSLVGMFVL